MSDDITIGPDGSVLLPAEAEERRRIDPPLPTGGAPDTRQATTLRMEYEAVQKQLHRFEEREKRARVNLTNPSEAEYRDLDEEEIVNLDHRREELQQQQAARRRRYRELTGQDLV